MITFGEDLRAIIFSPFPFLPVSWTTAMGQVDGGHRAGSRIEDRLDDAHLKGIHDASHVVGFLEVEDRCI